MTTTATRSLVVLLLAVAAAGCAGTPAATGATTGTAPVPPPADAATAGRAASDAAAIARARADSARHPYTAADIRFMQGMIAHHAQALLMARMAPTHGASPDIRTLAGRIINAQQDEIGIMQHWLRDRRQAVPEPDTAMAAAAGHDAHAQHGAAHAGAAMPGMLTAEQLRQLDAARGKDFDVLFLRLMIQHHRGATAMVEELFRTDGAAQDEGVFRLASDVNVDQITEIGRMERMLLDRLLEGGSR